jgi:hypothetical protein
MISLLEYGGILHTLGLPKYSPFNQLPNCS